MDRSPLWAQQILQDNAPVLFKALSPLAQRMCFPVKGIMAQSGEAKVHATDINASIGQITDGKGSAMPLPSLLESISMEGKDVETSFLYGPVSGMPELRSAWSKWQRRHGEQSTGTLPICVAGMTNALLVVAEMFCSECTPIAIGVPHWGFYPAIFTLRSNTKRFLTADLYDGATYRPQWVSDALEGVEEGTPALVVVTNPGNPAGHAISAEERKALIHHLQMQAKKRPLLVVCDDAYQGFVYDDAPCASLFWELQSMENIVPIKIDGATKELGFFGGRVGFLTFPYEPESKVAMALESLVKALVYSSLVHGSMTAQTIVTKALRNPSLADEVEAMRNMLGERAQAIVDSLSKALQSKPALQPHIHILPCNAGCFCVVHVVDDVWGTETPAEAIRQALLKQGVGVVALGGRMLRMAFCSVDVVGLTRLGGIVMDACEALLKK